MFSRTPEKAHDLMEDYFGDQADYALGNVVEDLEFFTDWLVKQGLGIIQVNYVLVEWIKGIKYIADRDSD